MTAKMNVPETAAAGEAVEVKVLISHPMETGFRRALDGKAIPRNIIREIRCTYDGREVFRADLHPAIAANPFFAFYIRATRSGDVTLSWHDEEGDHAESRPLTVT
jgi:sulfur-oxidizing protein SoxZ